MTRPPVATPSAPPCALPVRDAAPVLGLTPRALRRLIRRDGAPVVRRGRKGAGGATLVDPRAIRAWLDARDLPDERVVHEIDSTLLLVIGDALHDVWQATDGDMNKRKLARVFVAAYDTLSMRVHATLRHYAPTLPDTDTTLPDSVRRMALVARHS